MQAVAGTTGQSATRSCLPPFDGAVALLRRQWDWLLPWYVLAMGPWVAAAWLIFDAVAAQDRAALLIPSALLVLATVWRWLGLATIQQRVLAEMRGGEVQPMQRRWLPMLVLRMWGCFLFTWGGCLIVLPLWGMFISAFAAPALLEDDKRWQRSSEQMFSLINRSLPMLGRASAVLGLLWMWLAVAAFGSQFLLAYVLLPSLLGVDTTGWQLTMRSWTWVFSTLLLVSLAIDLYWTVASVLLLDHLRTRRTGSDLTLRLKAMEAAA